VLRALVAVLSRTSRRAAPIVCTDDVFPTVSAALIDVVLSNREPSCTVSPVLATRHSRILRAVDRHCVRDTLVVLQLLVIYGVKRL